VNLRLDRAMQRTKRRRPGQALVEFALIGMILVALLSIVADVGRVFYFDTVARASVREGARVATDATASDNDVVVAVERASPGVTVTVVSVTPAFPRSAYSGQRQNATVTATFSVGIITPIVKAVMGDTHIFSRSATMQIL
jgi:Flp pilus assembly protein TadG